MSLRFVLIFLVLVQLVFPRWGWESHRYINDAAVDRLPIEMSFFQDHRDYLREHSVDPDQSSDPNPGYYHYIDIDYFEEFFTGGLPHEWADMIAMYGQSTVESQGVIPWVIEWWLEDMTGLMANGDWGEVWQVAAELGHYIADSHQPMHLTTNYNGQETGNYGIHSRYETQMMNRNLQDIDLPDSTGHYWDTPIDSVFQYIEDIYPVVGLVLEADDQAYALDPNHGDTYYQTMWTLLGDTTLWVLNRTVVDLASLWYTAWIDAGSPYPVGASIEDTELPIQRRINNYPNPFNGRTNILISGLRADVVELSFFDLQGRLLKRVSGLNPKNGSLEYQWHGDGARGQDLGSGIYLVVASQGYENTVHKMILAK